VRALYKMSRSGYAAAALTSGGLGEAVKRIKYLGLIAERDRTVIREYGSALNRLAVRQAEITEKKDDILRRKRVVETKKAELEARRRKKAEILGSVRGEKSLYEQTLRELEESSVSLWAMIKKAEREKRAVKAAAPPRRPAGTGIPEKNRLPWPLDGPVLTRFGMQRHPQFGTTVFRRGIEIEAHEGEAVRAVNDGQVAYADWYKGYGKLVILEHGNGLYTLYGNLSRLDLKKGDRVIRGQVIGLAGDTGSLKGSKLYFEIRQNGEAQDPLAWLAKR
jgi:septal ring factor EnvC (AmiA/AmiB activator)